MRIPTKVCSLREAARKEKRYFLVARPLRGGGGAKKNYFFDGLKKKIKKYPPKKNIEGGFPKASSLKYIKYIEMNIYLQKVVSNFDSIITI